MTRPFKKVIDCGFFNASLLTGLLTGRASKRLRVNHRRIIDLHNEVKMKPPGYAFSATTAPAV
jgi:hypothetical protein